MELIFTVFMLGAGGALAVFVLTAMKLARAEEERDAAAAPPQRDSVAASLLFHIVSAGGVGTDEALRRVRRGTGIAAQVTRGIDVTNWAESYARASTPKQRETLLELAVQLVANGQGPVPLRQYAALLDLSFGLGFQTDALAKLRQQYGFDYIDHAKDARPKSADRGGGAAPLFVREQRSREQLLAILGMQGNPTKAELGAAYRRLVTQHHPDKYHTATAQAQSDAAARFIEITRAYEELLLVATE